ncbi:MAG TPA: ADP-polyphosphate phosphotransferase [Candidatus Binatia bacterium]
MKVQCDLNDYRIGPGIKVDLSEWPTNIKPLSQSKKHYRKLLAEYRAEISELQGILYAHNRYAMLLIFQGMDTAGKGGAIKHVMSGVNPQGCQVFSFQEPSNEELDHDFLWRANKSLPERGRIGIFDRSYYEEVLIVRVIPKVLQRQRLPAEFVHPETIWKQRYRDIVNLEDYLHRNGTRIIKFFLHLSKEEQRHRLLARIDTAAKNWKLSRADIEIRRLWDKFQSAYEDCLSATSSEFAPWYAVPADEKRNARLIVSQIIVDTMKTLRMDYPVADKRHLKELKQIKRMLEKEGK